MVKNPPANAGDARDGKESTCQRRRCEMVKNPPANAGDARDAGSVPGSGRPPGEGNGSPLQCSCLESPRTEEPGRLQLDKESDTT